MFDAEGNKLERGGLYELTMDLKATSYLNQKEEIELLAGTEVMYLLDEAGNHSMRYVFQTLYGTMVYSQVLL